MFNSGSESASVFKRELPPVVSEGQQPLARGLTSSTALFAVPEDREVLQTPEENRNSGYVFGQGPPRSTLQSTSAPPVSQNSTLSGETSPNNGSMDTNAPPTSEPTTNLAASSFRSVPSSSGSELLNDAAATACASTEPINTDVFTSVYQSPSSKDMSIDLSTVQSEPQESATVSNPPPAETNPSTDDNTPITTAENSLMSTSHVSTSLLLAPPTFDASAPATQPIQTVSEVHPRSVAVTASQPVFSAANSFAPQQSLIEDGCWNPCHGYVVPHPSVIQGIRNQLDQMREMRERAAREPLPADIQARVNRIRQSPPRKNLRIQESAFEDLPKSWLDQCKEAEEAKARRNTATVSMLKRAREESEEDRQDVLASEQARFKQIWEQANAAFENEAEASKQPVLIDGLTTEELKQRLPEPFRESSYYVLPDRSNLLQILISQGKDALKKTMNVTLGRKGFGEISFNGPINLENIDFEKEIEIKHGHVSIKDAKRIAEIPVTITLHKVFKELLYDVHELTEKSLLEICDKPGREFVSYDERGTWVFKVDNLADI